MKWDTHRIVLAVTIAVALALLMFLLPAFTLAAYAADDSDQSIAITVVVPRPEINTAPPQVHHLYPTHVWENNTANRREIIRVYELREDESPAHIPREAFERDGFRYELAEIVRREMPAHSTKEHIEGISVSTQTNDLATIIKLLAPTLEYLTDEGYFGVLALDISSIATESDGTRTTSHGVSITREFPHLSNTDTSLVPRTITEGGRTYNLASVDWRTQGTAAVDHTQIASSFTAVATYSGTATRTSTIGYTTTAEYRGQISRIATGRTEFTVHFIGIPIVTPMVSLVLPEQEATYTEDHETAEPQPTPAPVPVPEEVPEPVPTTAVIDSVTVQNVHIGGIVIEREIVEQDILGDEISNESADENGDEAGGSNTGNIFTAILFIAGLVLAYFAGKKGKAMLGMLKKAACIILPVILILGLHEVAFASQTPELPSYSFGRGREEAALHTAPSHANANHYNYGEDIGKLTVERLGRTINVIAGATDEAMGRGAGHFSFTGLNTGNTGLIGHNRGRTGYFSFVRELQEGDIITLEAGGVTRSYSVAMLYTIDESDFGSLMQFENTRLTLITCLEYVPGKRRVAVAFEGGT